ncbi:MAG: NUDIX domain-containing protein [Hyphomicrobiales bacterium]|nr:NUDIX domain-containing protein [Hyphomicrobiales bacterium]
MTQARIIPLTRIEAVFAPREWDFARERESEIKAHWAALKARSPALFDGRVLLQYQRRIEDGVFHARYLATNYSAFIAWRDLGWPDKNIINGFSMAALRANDGAFLLGEMAAHTANPGKIYFAAGTPDPDDITASGEVDLLGNLLRELEEETGLAPAEVNVGDGWTAVFEGQRIAFMRPVTIDMEAQAARRLILSRLAQQQHPELADMHIIGSVDEIDEARMPPFGSAYLRHMLTR